jgi:hypothetical protein
MAERIRLENPVKSRKRGFDDDMAPVANRGDGLWQYGWTHYGTAGQTPARLHPHSRAVEIKDGNEWIRCAAGTDTFFTRDYLSA